MVTLIPEDIPRLDADLNITGLTINGEWFVWHNQ